MMLNHASRFLPKDGESCCGDAVFVRLHGDLALFVLIDVLGHGHNACRVAEQALRLLERLPPDSAASTAIEALHQGLHGSRGAVATAFSLRESQAELCGVGNVSFRALGFRGSFVPSPGVLGLQSPRRISARFKLSPGQGMLLHSDGISARFESERLAGLSPPALCEFLMNHHRHSHDDASVLAVRVEDLSRSRS